MSIDISPLRIALCITELDVGGAERCLVELATRLDRRRFAPVVYALSAEPGPATPSLVPQLREAGIETHFLGGRRASHFPRIVGRLTQRLRAQQAELVQSFLFHANLAARLAARRAGVGHVLSGIRVAEHSARWHLWLDRLTARLVDRYVCVSQSVADFSREAAGLPGDKLVVIPNGIDVERYQRAEPLDLTSLGLAADRRAVTFVGRLDRQKGLLDFLRQSPRWLERFPLHDLLLVGAGPQEDELRSEADKLAISSHVRFAGWRGDVPRILRASDLFVLPSHWEGMPNALLEAMAAGLPVVAADVEGVRELLGEGAQRQVVARRDPAAFCEQIIALLGDRALADRCGAENQRRARNFSWQAMVDAYQRLFHDVAGRGS
ncbi:MAG TPA: glycosyltransferase [Pirellulales bacterium]|nr:glycosyltransferase [Pirellulales bacterium]